MKVSRVFFAAAFSALACAAAEAPDGGAVPSRGVYHFKAKCRLCGGAGKISVAPPDKGQFDGLINSKSHWNSKAVCTACGGRGRREYLRTEVYPSGDVAEMPPCRKCGWSGVEKCRKCVETGYVRCRNPGCSSGWNVVESSGSMSGGRKKPPSVTPCAECRGLGKVVCAACGGRGGVPCSECKGVGFDSRAVEKKQREEERRIERQRNEEERRAERQRREEERKAERQRREEERKAEREKEKKFRARRW